MPVQTVIKLRRDTAANWDTTNPVLAAGEMGIETDTSLHKFGDGTTAWGALQYSSSSRITQQVKNTTGSAIPKGSVVYISGATGGEALISLADADTEATSSKTIGLTTTAISNDALGMVIEQGLLVGVNTASATAGQSVWLSSTAGQFVFGAPPAKPAHSVYLGVVVRVHATEGEILVKVQNGYELNELHDVDAGSPSTGQVLQWNGTAWVNATVDALPSQSGQNGKYLTTDGSTASWGTITIPPGTTVSDTAPSSPSVGQLWWESDTGILYIYYDGFWVEATAGIVGPQGDSGVVQSATAPTDTSLLWIDTTESGEMVVPAGGTAGQALVKATSTNYDTTWAGPYPTSPNYIINGAFDIWQRGTSYTNPTNFGYTVDRWRPGYDGSGATRILSQQTHTPGAAPVAGQERAYFHRYNQSVAGSGATYNLFQTTIEDVRTLAGQTATLSFYAKAAASTTLPSIVIDQFFGLGGSSQVETTAATNIALTTSWQRFTYTVSIPSIAGKTIGASSNLGITFKLPLNSTFTFDLDGVQLEAGSVATPFRRNANTLQGELAACQRYCYVPTADASPFTVVAQVYGISTSNGWGFVEYPVTMRVKPTMTIDNLSNFNYGFSTANVSLNGLALNGDGSNLNKGLISYNLTSNIGSATQTGTIYRVAGSGLTGQIIFSAEL